MVKSKTFVFHGFFVLVGFACLVIGGLSLVVSLLMSAATVSSVKNGPSDMLSSERKAAADSLRKIDGVPESFALLFQTNDVLASQVVTNLPLLTQPKALAILQHYELNGRFSAAVIPPMAAVVGGGISVVGFCFAAVLLLLGIVFLLRRKIWLCVSCRFSFKRG